MGKENKWGISCNPEIFDAISAFKELETVDWKQSGQIHFEIGDIVYIYISKKNQGIRIKTKIEKLNLTKDEIINDTKFVLDAEKLGTSSNYMRLKLVENLTGTAFDIEKLKLFDFVSPQGPMRIKENINEYLSFIERLQKHAEINPSTYDASYELMTEVIKSYSKMEDLSECDFNDLDLIYLSTVGTWSHSVEKKKECINKSNLPQTEKNRLIDYISKLWERVNAREFTHCENESKITFGMFGTGFYTTKTKTDSINSQKLIKMCIDLSAVDNDEKAFEIVEKNLANGFKGLATAGISVILHCLKPFIFPILNANQGKRNIFEKLGIELQKVSDERTYINNTRKIKEYRDSNFTWKNYRIFDKESFELSQGEFQMQNDLINETKTLLENTKNLILTGAPGTGKTYLAKQIAKAMGCKDNEIGFVQFHPSYDYTDFVEGLRPIQNDGNNQIGFERKDGVFKEFCAKALKNLVDSRKTESELDSDNIFQIIYEMLINDIEEGICSLYKTAKGDFSVSIHENGNLCFEQNNPKKIYVKKDYLEILFNVIKDDNDLDIKNISREDMDKLVGDNVKTISHVDYIQYRWALNQLLERYKQIKNTYTSEITEKIQAKNFVFIIDEINRGEVSKIFGELFYSVDSGYRITANDLEKAKSNKDTVTTIRTQYANLETDGNHFDRALNTSTFGHFFIPENVYIIGTMNDIDRSVESMDFAFRRRFAWKEITADDTQYMLDEVEKDGETFGLPDDIAVEAKERMNRVNNKISELPDFNSAYHIGASYFLKLKNYESDSDNGFQSLWNYHLKGILEEYLRGNPDKDKYLKQLEDVYKEESEKTSNQ